MSPKVCVCVCVCVCLCSGRLGPQCSCSRPVMDCSAQHYCNIHSFSSNPHTRAYAHTRLHTQTHTHTHAYSMRSVPLANADSGYMAAAKNGQRADNTRSFGPSRRKRVASLDKFTTRAAAALTDTSLRVFFLMSPPSVFTTNNDKKDILPCPLRPAFTWTVSSVSSCPPPPPPGGCIVSLHCSSVMR